jgi:hypothetical protein
MPPSLSLQALMQHFRKRWSSLPDHRKPNNNQNYTLADGASLAYSGMDFHGDLY